MEIPKEMKYTQREKELTEAVEDPVGILGAVLGVFAIMWAAVQVAAVGSVSYFVPLLAGAEALLGWTSLSKGERKTLGKCEICLGLILFCVWLIFGKQR